MPEKKSFLISIPVFKSKISRVFPTLSTINISFKNLQFGAGKNDLQFGAGRFSMKKSKI
jgi:hypothetical protein